MARAVVFDLDYTLAVPERDRATLLAAASEAAGAPALSREAYLEAHGDVAHETTRAPIFERLLSESEGSRDSDTGDIDTAVTDTADADTAVADTTVADTADADPEAIAAAYREAVAESVRPIAGAAELVTDLRRRYAVGLLTDGPVLAGRSKLEALGWTDLFDAAVVTGEVGADKPDPRAFEAVCERLGVAPEEAVYVGDDPDLDVAGATAAGMAAVQVLYEGGPDPDSRATATVQRGSLAEALPGLLADLD